MFLTQQYPVAKASVALFFLALLMVSSSCVRNKHVAYFKNIPDSTHGSKIPLAAFQDPIIQPDDILSITIQTIDPQTSLITNQISGAMPSVGSSSASTIGQQTISGYMVDRDSLVELPMIGKVKLGGLTTFQARDLIREKSSAYFKNTTVNVRFANFRVVVLGEVLRPATYTVPNEKVSLLDALGLAGDLTIYGKRENVMLIRDNNGKKEIERFNLNSSDIFQSPYFYLKQNDVVYVEPTKAKAASLNVARAQMIALIGTGLSVLIVLFSRITIK